VIEGNGLTKRAKYHRVNAGNVASADGVHTDSTLLTQGVFAGSAVGDRFVEIPTARSANILGQRKSTATRSIFLETMVLLDDLNIVFGTKHRSDFSGQREQGVHANAHVGRIQDGDLGRGGPQLLSLLIAQAGRARNQGDVVFEAVIDGLAKSLRQ